MLPSTSGGHDPISAARGCDRCFLPGLALDWGWCAKTREEATQGAGEPPNGELCTQPAAGAVASATERSQGPPYSLARTLAHRPGGAVKQRTKWEPGGWRQGTRHSDSGLEPESGGRLGRYGRLTRQGSPSHTHTTRAHVSPRSPLSSPTVVTPLPHARWYL